MSKTGTLTPSVFTAVLLSLLLPSCGGGGSSRGGGGMWTGIQTQPPNIGESTFFMIDTNGNFYSSGENGSGMYVSTDHGALRCRTSRLR